jgi:DNA-directed RNA polymerase subunit RPC12/RpoP
MSFFQRLFKAILPAEWARAMEADSRSWMVRCPCGFARSVWEMGGIRWKAAGEPRVYRKCPECGQRSWHKVSRDRPPASEPRQS